MSEQTRNVIQNEVCRAFVAMINNNISEAQAALFRILDLIDEIESK